MLWVPKIRDLKVFGSREGGVDANSFDVSFHGFILLPLGQARAMKFHDDVFFILTNLFCIILYIIFK